MERVVAAPENSKTYYENLQDSIIPRTTNVVSGFDIGVEVNPQDIAKRALIAEYNPKRFNAVIMRIREPKTTALIFPSGRIIVTGAKNENDSKLACRKIARVIQKLNYTNVQFKNWKVINMVGMIELPIKINLFRLQYNNFFLERRWEPEIFPALMAKILKPKITLLIFASGKVVALGFRKSEDLHTAFDLCLPAFVEVQRNGD